MAYVKNTWVDREGTTRYFETVDEDGALIFTPNYDKVTEIGTPVNADNMNHIEEGLVGHEERITTLEESENIYVNKSGDTMTGELFMNGANIRMYQDGISQAINTRNTAFVLADGAPTKAQAGFRMNSTDANGVITHYYQTDNPTNGDTYTAISNTVYVDGATKYYPFIIGVTGANVPYLKYNGKTMKYITDTYISGTSWYRIYNDGWCEQGGRVTGETVTFLKNFKNTNYMILKTLASSNQNATQDRTVSFWNLTVSGATTFVASGYWFACGFIE